MDGEPIQILKFDTNSRKYRVTEHLANLLLSDEIKETNIAIVSICGPLQQGKSLLLNFFLRYLHAEYVLNDSLNWLGSDFNPLIGFKWNTKSSRLETAGIWIWSKIFTKTLANGERIGVLLMDTQGTLIEGENKLFQMSTLLSSFQIYNLFNNIQEHDYKQFSSFMKYGKLSLQYRSDKPLQTLLFLIRDWQCPYNFDYGKDGGRQYINSVLNLNEKSCFENIDGFLMPHPGFKTSLQNFNGKIKDIEFKFKECLFELAPLILTPENINVKLIHGANIKGKDFVSLFHHYWKLFNIEGSPLPEIILENTSSANNYLVKNEIIQYYNAFMWQCIGSVKEFLPVDTVNNIHNAALQSSIEIVKSKAIKINENIFENYFKDLVGNLQSQLKIYLTQNESKKISVPAIQKKEQSTSIAIGIDFGTTNTRVAVYHNEKVELIENDNGNFFTPSFVAFTIEERLIGDTAKNQVALNPCNTFFDLKRFVGRKFDDFIVSFNKNHLPFEITKYDEKLVIIAEYKNVKKVFMPEEIIAMLLTKIKESAEKYLCKIISNAVITVPANFNNSQRRSILDSAKIAGLNVLRLLNEPTAAAITFGIDKKIEEKRNILVYDLGGGKLDVSIITIENDIYEVKSTVGDTHFGGNDFDNRLVEHFAKEFTKKHGHDLSSDKRALQRLKNACEKAKRILSGSINATIDIDPLFNGIDYCLKITRSLFEELNDDLFHKTIEFIKDALCYVEIDKSEIDDVILVGGSSRIPKIQKLVQEFFDGKKLNKTINADEAVVSGAAIQASILNGNLSEKIKNIRIQDVTPLSLGTEMKNNLLSILFENNSKIPKSENLKLYHFNSNNDEEFFFYIFEVIDGDKKKNLLGKFTLSEIPQGIRWPTLIGVTFSINENGVFQLSAFVKSSGKNIKVTTEENINENDIKRMIDNAEHYRNEDKLQEEKVIAKNKLESFCFKIKSLINDESKMMKNCSLAYKISNDLMKQCNETIEWLSSNELANTVEYEKRLLKIQELFNNYNGHDVRSNITTSL